MCGIAGIITFDGSSVPVEKLQEMLDRLRHRGPDEHGFLWADAAGRTSVKLDRSDREPQECLLPIAGLAHARLAILDIARGKQPLSNEDLSVWVTFNGEIYNHHELRERLTGLGHRFDTSHSDTEVIVHAYEEWGEDCLPLFRGMFAFALLDLRRKRLLLARDRFGVKPLYYLNIGGLFAFASELDSLRAALTVSPEIDLQAIYDYLLYQYIPAPASVYRNMSKLLPGHFCRVSLESGATETLPYWVAPSGVANDADFSENRSAAELLELLGEAVRLRLVADVPVGAFLSGGIDSATVVALMRAFAPEQEIKTFSIGFEEDKYNELDGARFIARRFGTLHEDCVISTDSFQIIPELASALDEPLGDPSFLPTYLVSRMAAAKSLKVVVSGDGGDEAFAGYNRYLRGLLFHRVVLPVPLFLRKGAARALGRLTDNGFFGDVARRLPLSLGGYYSLGICHYSPLELVALFRPEVLAEVAGKEELLITGLVDTSGESSVLNRLRFTDLQTYLPGAVLTKVDRASMAWSLEVRSPFLDHAVHDFAARLPSKALISGMVTKRFLRKAMSAHLPADYLRRPKKGFGIPLDSWLRTATGEAVTKETLNGDSAVTRWLEPAGISRLIAGHVGGRYDAGFKIWSLLMLENWLRSKQS